MSDFRTVPGFEDVWRPPVRTRVVRATAILSPPANGDDIRKRLARIVDRAPEVMVKITGRTRDADHLLAHLRYISRNGQLDLEGPDGQVVVGRQEVDELAADWAAAAAADSRRRGNSPVSLSVVLSMPTGTNEIALRDAARAFAEAAFGERHDYVLTLHTDTPRPHVHLSICSRGCNGERLNPKKADLEQWRQTFAEALRERGVEAEASPRRARGLTRKPERTPLRKIRERHEMGKGSASRVRRAAYHEAAKSALGGRDRTAPWEKHLLERQQRVRSLYLSQAMLMQRSGHGSDRDLGFRLEAFVRAMPPPDTQTLSIARELRERAGLERKQRSPNAGGRERV